jgi:YaiO family outer membrane protein
MKKLYGLLVVLFLLCGETNAQQWKSLGVDDLFQLARKNAFNGKREEAREMLRFILEKSPDYSDVRILLGRTYAWDGQRDAARKEFQTVLTKDTENLDALNAWTDVEMWDDQYTQALPVADRGLKSYPNDEDLLYKRASILNSLNRQEEALLTLNTLLTLDPAHERGAALLKSIKSSRLKYTAGVTYGLDLFSRTFKPAHYASAQLARTNTWGSSIIRFNYANRFSTQGLQSEIDLYPKIVSGVYAYLNYGYSSTDLFPKHRVGAEIFSKLPKSFEASAGVRYLYFDSETKVAIYTGSIGWYFKDYWISLRPYITPDKQSGTSVSASLTLRRYLEGADTYVGFSAGLGFSPDLRRIQSSSGLTNDAIYLLHSQRTGLALQKLLRPDLQLNASFDLNRQELIFDKGNYVIISSFTVGMRKKF